MKNDKLSNILCLTVTAAVFWGCEFETVTPPPPNIQRARNIVINEVFTLPRDNPVRYNWIEFYNPTGDTINLKNWTITMATSRGTISRIVAEDTLGNRFEFGRGVFYDTLGVFDVPFSEGFFSSSARLPPGGLFTIVDNEGRLLDHTNWGPGDQRFRRERPVIEGPLLRVDTLSHSDTLTILNIRSIAYRFYVDPKQQLVLKDSAGGVIDVVRMGDSVYTNVINDSVYTSPLLSASNRSIGAVPEFESAVRYAGGYFTGNTANDFYVTRGTLRPIPQWYSQLHK